MASGEDIKRAREARGMSQSALASAVGITQPAIKKIESGQTLRSRYTIEIARFLGLDGVDSPAQPQGYRPPPEVFGDRDLPVYSAAEGGPGEMVVSTDPIDIVPRPWYMREVRDGYAVLIVGDSMEPVFEPGDMAIVNPRLPAMRNKNTIFVTGEHGGAVGGEFRATVKRLVRWDQRSWYVRQYNEPKEFALERREWPLALRVVGKYEGGS